MDARPVTDDQVHVITLPPKDRVNLGLAAVAGALALLVLFTAHDRLSAGAARPATPAQPTATALPTETPTETPRLAPVAPKGGEKGKGHD